MKVEQQQTKQIENESKRTGSLLTRNLSNGALCGQEYSIR